MPEYILRHTYSEEDSNFIELTPQENEGSRSHPGNPIKERFAYHGGSATAGVADLPDDRVKNTVEDYQFLLRNGQTAKIVSYSAAPLQPFEHKAQSTGTSQINVPCLTTDLDVCLAVTICGENIRDGEAYPGAKIRVFHIFPQNKDVIDDLRDYVEKLEAKGLTISVAMHGGMQNTPASVRMGNNIRNLFAKELREKVHVKVDKLFEGSSNEARLDLWPGAVITKTNRVKFIHELLKETQFIRKKQKIRFDNLLNAINSPPPLPAPVPVPLPSLGICETTRPLNISDFASNSLDQLRALIRPKDWKRSLKAIFTVSTSSPNDPTLTHSEIANLQTLYGTNYVIDHEIKNIPNNTPIEPSTLVYGKRPEGWLISVPGNHSRVKVRLLRNEQAENSLSEEQIESLKPGGYVPRCRVQNQRRANSAGIAM